MATAGNDGLVSTARTGRSEAATRPVRDLPELTAPAALEWQCTVAWHPQPARVGAIARLPVEDGALPLGRNTPAFRLPGGAEVALDDRHVSRHAITVRRAADGWHLERPAGASRLRVNGREVTHRTFLSRAEARRGIALTLGFRIVLHLALAEQPGDGAAGPAPDFGLLGVGRAMDRLRRRIEEAAASGDDVLLIGPTGTGKELVARALHGAGGRRSGPWVAVNMAAIPQELAAASLFGARRGAFTGAHGDQPGFFARAAGGTLFLDEVGDTPVALQPLLLRALQEREIQVLGGSVQAVDLTVVSAMERDPDDARLGFRRALRHRLGVQEIRLPALAERAEDIGLLAVAFLCGSAKAGTCTALAGDIPDAQQPRWVRLFELLLLHDWPGNVRELEHAVRQVAAASNSGLVVPEPLLSRLQRSEARRAADEVVGEASEAPSAVIHEGNGDEAESAAEAPTRLADLDEDAFFEAWCHARFEVATLARQLGVSRAAIYRRVRASRRCRLAGDVPLAELLCALDACRGNLARTAERLAVSRRGLEARLRVSGVSVAADAARERDGS